MVPLVDLFVVTFIGVGCLLLTGIVLLQNSKRALNRVFAFLSVAVGVWIVAAFLSDIPELVHLSLFLNRFLLISVLVVIVGMFYLAYTFPSQSKIPFWLNAIILVPSIAVAILTLFTPLTIVSVKLEEWGSDPVYGLVFSMFGILASVVIGIAVLKFILNYRRSQGLYKLQMKYLFVGLFVFMLNNIVVHMILANVLGTAKYYKFGNYSAIIFVGFLGFAIIKHRLMDIRSYIARAVAYVLLIAILGFFYVLSFLTISDNILRVDAARSQVFFSAVLSLIIAFSFQPLLRIIERVTDKIFFQDKYDSEKLLNYLGTLLTKTLSIEVMGEEVLQTLMGVIKTDRGALMLISNDRITHTILQGTQSKQVELQNCSRLFNRRLIYVFDELSEGKRKEMMRANGFGCIVPLKSKTDYIGVLALGFKKSGMAYTSQDLELLEVFSKQLSIAIQNALHFEEIQHFSEKLKQQVDIATHNLKLANNKLKELDKRKDEFLSVAAHEMRAPLTAVKGFLSMILEGDGGEISTTVKDFVEGAIEGADREVRLVNNLLNVSRIEEGRLVYEMGYVNLGKVVTAVYNDFKLDAQQKGLAFTLSIDNNINDRVYVDMDRIHEVVANFVSNAIKYTDKGTVTINLLQKDSKLIRFEVTDTGFGISKEEQQKLYQKFYRCASSNGKVLGTGLGLYIVKLLIEKFSGTLGLTSELGKGSTFWFELPVIKHKNLTKTVKMSRVTQGKSLLTAS